jgi:predicted DNA-binding transcriptional regulator AlpA
MSGGRDGCSNALDTMTALGIRLDPGSVEAVARRVVELLGGEAALLDATSVAQRLGRSREWVYRHADELGAVRLGDGDRPRLGFAPAKVAEYLDACKSSRRTPDPSNRAAMRKARGTPGGVIGQGADLLPIRGEVPPE